MMMMTASGPSETVNSPTAETELASARMMQFITGSFVSQVVRTFAESTIADLLAEQPLTALEIATVIGAHAEATMRLLRAGTALGLVTVDSQARFFSTPMLRTLQQDAQDHYAAWRSPSHHQVPGFLGKSCRRRAKRRAANGAGAWYGVF